MPLFSSIILLVKSFLQNYSLFPLFESIRDADNEGTKRLSKALHMRGRQAMDWHVSVLGYNLITAPDAQWTAVNHVIVLWLMAVRRCFEGNPHNVLKEQVVRNGPILPTLAYFIPDVYLFIFIVTHFVVTVGMKAGIPILFFAFLGHFGGIAYAYEKFHIIAQFDFRKSGDIFRSSLIKSRKFLQSFFDGTGGIGVQGGAEDRGVEEPVPVV